MKTAICLHNATVLTGFSIMHNCAFYIKNDKIADVYNEERFRQKKFSPKVKIIDVGGAYVMPGMIDTHIHGIGGAGADDAKEKSIVRTGFCNLTEAKSIVRSGFCTLAKPKSIVRLAFCRSSKLKTV